MWLSRFSRAFASARAKGISSERSATPSPWRFNRSSWGTELLILTPSSAVSHITPPHSFTSHRYLPPLPRRERTEVRVNFHHRHFSFTQLTISIRLANQTSENDLAYLMASS